MVERFFDCSVLGCRNLSARATGAGCDLCQRYFCGIHMSQDFHKCSIATLSNAEYEELMASEIRALRGLINDHAVCKLASRLNKNRSCKLEHPSKTVGTESLTGCANYHVRVRFDDASRPWLMRVPRVTGFAVGLPNRLAEYLIRSEYATLKLLETTAVPAPRAYTFGIPSEGTDYGIGVCFLLMEELPGKPWDGQSKREKIWKGVSAIYAELEKHPFDKAGSLSVRHPTDSPSVDAVASDRFVCIEPFGPHDSPKAYYTAWTEQYLTLIADGQLYPQFSVDAYLVYRFLQDHASVLSATDKHFFLKHVDDKGDHIMVDEDGNVTGIIDWQMARVVPRSEAFALSLISADMTFLCNGIVSLSGRDIELRNEVHKQHITLANRMGNERMRRFFWGLGLESEWAYALPLAEAALESFGVDQTWKEWKENALEEYREDERLAALLHQQSTQA